MIALFVESRDLSFEAVGAYGVGQTVDHQAEVAVGGGGDGHLKSGGGIYSVCAVPNKRSPSSIIALTEPVGSICFILFFNVVGNTDKVGWLSFG